MIIYKIIVQEKCLDCKNENHFINTEKEIVLTKEEYIYLINSCVFIDTSGFIWKEKEPINILILSKLKELL